MIQAVAMIMAAGAGERFRGGVPKQLVSINGRPAVAWSIETFAACSQVSELVVVTPANGDSVKEAVEQLAIPKVKHIVTGGETRQESVRLGMETLGEDCKHVLVHDAARPCMTAGLITRVLEVLETSPAVVPTIPVVDTLVRDRAGEVEAILDRVHIAGVQTPQGFDCGILRRAHKHAHAVGLTSSDDASLVLALDESVKTIEGERTNIKITFPEDIVIAEAILQRSASKATGDA